jgi:hypothetical protein
MSSVEVLEKIEIAPEIAADKKVLPLYAEATRSLHDTTDHGTEGLHFVTRGKVISEDDGSDVAITGYDAHQMRARALLSYEEEKKLFRRIDWHLMPLMSIMYLLKNLDAANVGALSCR